MKKAFTLIELLVVVLIIGILSAVALPLYQKAVQKSKVMQLVMASRSISDAQKVYHLANGTYTIKNDELDISYPLMPGSTSSYKIGEGHCSLQGTGMVNCYLSIPYIVIQRIYKNDRLSCCSYPLDNYAGASVCQQITQTPNWTNYCSEDYVCRCY